MNICLNICVYFQFCTIFRFPVFYWHSFSKLLKLLHNSKCHCENKHSKSIFQTFFSFCLVAIGEPESIDWYNPQGEKIISTQRVMLQKEGVRSRLTIYNANIEDAGIYRCQATDAKGQTQEATVVLEIYRKLFNCVSVRLHSSFNSKDSNTAKYA